MKKRKFSGQATLELIIVYPLMLFFIIALFLNGYKVYAILANANVNYSEGMSSTRRPSQVVDFTDRIAADYVLEQNLAGATLEKNVVTYTNMHTTDQYAHKWGGRTVLTGINPPSSMWNEYVSRAGSGNYILDYVMTYPAAPFISVFPEGR